MYASLTQKDVSAFMQQLHVCLSLGNYYKNLTQLKSNYSFAYIVY